MLTKNLLTSDIYDVAGMLLIKRGVILRRYGLADLSACRGTGTAALTLSHLVCGLLDIPVMSLCPSLSNAT